MDWAQKLGFHQVQMDPSGVAICRVCAWSGRYDKRNSVCVTRLQWFKERKHLHPCEPLWQQYLPRT